MSMTPISDGQKRAADATPVPSRANTALASAFAAEHETLMKYEAILNNASVGIAFTKDRIIQHANSAFESLFGWAPGSIVGQPGSVVWATPEEYAEVGAVVGPVLAEGKPVEIERRNKRQNGTLFWARLQARPVDKNNPITGGTIWIIEDVTERRHAVEQLRRLNTELERRVTDRTEELARANIQLLSEMAERQQAEARARHLALHDELTGLPNRRLLQDRLTHALALARREHTRVAVMFVDLDRFKIINDTLGHAGGDEVLQQMGSRLTKALRDSDTVSRVGGDEFVMVLTHLQNDTNIAPIAAKVFTELSAPCIVNNRELRITPSIGVSVYPDDAEDAVNLLGFADAAMYHAKSLGRHTVQFYTAEMSAASQRRLRLEHDLHTAIPNGELALYYQPRIDFLSGKIVGYEALLRWHHPQDGLIAPGVFIPIAEESGLIVPIGDWVIRQACQQMKRWRESGFAVASVAVNLSARQFFDDRLPQRVSQAISDAGMEPAQLELEITESILMANTEETMSLFVQLRQLGVKLSIDDFGTGFSSLAYLKRFHVDSLKIDHSFVRDISTNADDAAIVRAIVSLAHSLQLRVVAEGVETREQLDFLRECGCEEAQGYYFAHPLPAVDVEHRAALPQAWF